MSAWLVAETLLLSLLLCASLLGVWQAVHPESLRRSRIALALALLEPARPNWIRRLGRRIAPQPRLRAGVDGFGCKGCGGSSSQPRCG